jgi:hypothetical protein
LRYAQGLLPRGGRLHPVERLQQFAEYHEVFRGIIDRQDAYGRFSYMALPGVVVMNPPWLAA